MPSHKSMCKITQKVSELIKNSQTIKQEILVAGEWDYPGWANYHHATWAKKSFSTIDHRMKMLWRWAKRRLYPNKGKQWIVNKYRKTHKGRKWTYILSRKEHPVPDDGHANNMKGQMTLNKTPFLEQEHLENRAKKHRFDRKKKRYVNRSYADSLLCVIDAWVKCGESRTFRYSLGGMSVRWFLTRHRRDWVIPMEGRGYMIMVFLRITSTVLYLKYWWRNIQIIYITQTSHTIGVMNLENSIL